MAQETGRVFLDNTGHWQTGMSEAEAAYHWQFHPMLKALEVLGHPPGSPADLVQHTPVYWLKNLHAWLPEILAYLETYRALLPPGPQSGADRGEALGQMGVFDVSQEGETRK
jgi:hypothetical protein